MKYFLYFLMINENVNTELNNNMDNEIIKEIINYNDIDINNVNLR